MKRRDCNCSCHNPPPGVIVNHCFPCCEPDDHLHVELPTIRDVEDELEKIEKGESDG